MNKKKYDIGFGYLGNGITVWNRLEEKHGDYVTIAHIDNNRNIKFYENLPEDIKKKIEHFAKNANPKISVTQDVNVFNN